MKIEANLLMILYILISCSTFKRNGTDIQDDHRMTILKVPIGQINFDI